MNKIKLLSWILCFLLTGCKDCGDEPQLTEIEKLSPATQEGKQTLGCLVDGRAWVTNRYTAIHSFYQEGVLAINAELRSNEIQSIFIHIYDEALSEREYALTEDIDQYSSFAGAGSYSDPCAFKTDGNHKGKLVVTHLESWSRK